MRIQRLNPTGVALVGQDEKVELGIRQDGAFVLSLWGEGAGMIVTFQSVDEATRMGVGLIANAHLWGLRQQALQAGKPKFVVPQ